MPDRKQKPSGRQAALQPLAEDLSLEQFYTDAEEARQAFENLLAAETLPRRILVIHGVGGVGKSTLLKMYRLNCNRQQVPVALMGGEEAFSALEMLVGWAHDLARSKVKLPHFARTHEQYRSIRVRVEERARKDTRGRTVDWAGKMVAKTAEATGGAAVGVAVGSVVPGVGTVLGTAVGGVMGAMGGEAFLDWLRSFLPRADLELYSDPVARLTQDFLQDLAPAAEKHRLVLMADTYEKMGTLDDWFCGVVRQLPANVLLVVAGRETPDWERAWPGWMGLAEIIELKEMRTKDQQTLVYRYYAHVHGGEPDPAQVEAIVDFSRGLPIAATTVVQLWVKYKVHSFHAVRPQVVADLVDRLLEGVPSEMRTAFETAAVLRYFNAESLASLLDEMDSEETYAELRRWPFIRPRREGLAMHDTVREMINEALETRVPSRFYMLHERAAAYYGEQQEQAVGSVRERMTLEQLYHSVRADEETGVHLFQILAEELTRYRQKDQLRTLLNDASKYPLMHETGHLWRAYYNARLAHLDAQIAQAERTYQAIIDREEVEPKLRAYTLCSLGAILSRSQRLAEPGAAERAIGILKQSLSRSPLDDYLVESVKRLERVYRHSHEWKKAEECHDQIIDFFDARGDRYGLLDALTMKEGYYAIRGMWGAMLATHRLGAKASSEIPNDSYVKAVFLGQLTWAWVFAGRCAEIERDVKQALEIASKLDDRRIIYYLRKNLGLSLAMQNRYSESHTSFAHSLETVRSLGREFYTHQAYIMGHRCLLLMREGKLEDAETELAESLAIVQKFHIHIDIPQFLVWLGQVHELKQDWNSAMDCYNRSLQLRRTGRNHFVSWALTGICRTSTRMGSPKATLKHLPEAESLAERYEYNDHLASLFLTKAQLALSGFSPESGKGFDAALRCFQQALIHALRHNRFLLDEILWGGGVNTPLSPIIPYCMEHNDGGRQMLADLLDWWQKGSSDTGVLRADTISPIPEGTTLMEAERIAREREPGDGMAQMSVIEKIEQALSADSDRVRK